MFLFEVFAAISCSASGLMTTATCAAESDCIFAQVLPKATPHLIKWPQALWYCPRVPERMLIFPPRKKPAPKAGYKKPKKSRKTARRPSKKY